MEHNLRLANEMDVPVLMALIERSVHGLQAAYYSEEQRSAAVGTLFGVDLQLILDQTYYVIEVEGNPVACGGWSYRRLMCGTAGDSGKATEIIRPPEGRARIRAFFVEPGWERRGLGSQLLAASEAACLTAGFTEVELAATLAGEPLYARHGYKEDRRGEIEVLGVTPLPVVYMWKKLSQSPSSS